MPDPVKTMLEQPAEVQRLWGKLPAAKDTSRDVHPMPSRVAQARARYAGMPDAQVCQTIHDHPRAADALDTLIAGMNKMVDAEDGEKQEDVDRLIVLPKRGVVDPDDAVEHGER